MKKILIGVAKVLLACVIVWGPLIAIATRIPRGSDSMESLQILTDFVNVAASNHIGLGEVFFSPRRRATVLVIHTNGNALTPETVRLLHVIADETSRRHTNRPVRLEFRF